MSVQVKLLRSSILTWTRTSKSMKKVIDTLKGLFFTSDKNKDMHNGFIKAMIEVNAEEMEVSSTNSQLDFLKELGIAGGDFVLKYTRKEGELTNFKLALSYEFDGKILFTIKSKIIYTQDIESEGS